MDIGSVFQDILQNQVVTGLSVTALLGGAMYQLRSIPGLLKFGALRFLTVELTVISSDPAFEWITIWLAKQPYSKRSKIMRLQSVSDPERTDAAEWSLAPGHGTHIFRWRHRPVFLTRSYLSKDSVDSHSRTSKPIEQFYFRTIGRSQQTIRRLISEAHALANENEMVSIRIWSEYHWMQVRGKTRRPLETIILKAGQYDRLIHDLNWFLEARDWYGERGIPYRRGYCFTGPPGVGKTSIVMGLAGFLGRPICVLNLGSVESDDALFDAFREAPVNAIILIEDIDCAFSEPVNRRDSADSRESSRVSKAALLNALDGITTPDGRIFIMTTNYPERLDAALMRPGRADVHETFGYFEAAEQIQMAQRFFDDFIPLPFAVSPAEMQAAFMQFHNDSEAARAHLLSKFAA